MENAESNSGSETNDHNSNFNGPIDNDSSHKNDDDDRNTELQICEKIVETTEKAAKKSKPKKNMKTTMPREENVKKKSIKKGANNTFQ